MFQPSPGQLERHETPDLVRSDAVNVRFQCVPQRTNRPRGLPGHWVTVGARAACNYRV